MFPMSHRWTVYVTPTSPKGWHKIRFCCFLPVKLNFCQEMCAAIFLGRLPNCGSRPNNNNIGVKCPSVRPSTKSFFDFDEIWFTGSTRWEMHNVMTLTQMQGQGQGHRDPKVAKSPKFKVYLLRQNLINLKTDGRLLHYRTISKI